MQRYNEFLKLPNLYKNNSIIIAALQCVFYSKYCNYPLILHPLLSIRHLARNYPLIIRQLSYTSSEVLALQATKGRVKELEELRQYPLSLFFWHGFHGVARLSCGCFAVVWRGVRAVRTFVRPCRTFVRARRTAAFRPFSSC